MIKNYLKLKDLEQHHQEQHRQLFFFGLAMLPNTFTTEPTTTEIPVGYMARYTNGNGVRKIYFNFDGTLTYLQLFSVI